MESAAAIICSGHGPQDVWRESTGEAGKYDTNYTAKASGRPQGRRAAGQGRQDAGIKSGEDKGGPYTASVSGCQEKAGIIL